MQDWEILEMTFKLKVKVTNNIATILLVITIKCRVHLGLFDRGIFLLTHFGADKMATIFQTTLSNAFSWMKMYEFLLKVHWDLFLRVLLTIFQHWFRWWLGTDQATRHYLSQWRLDYWRIYASLGLIELNWYKMVCFGNLPYAFIQMKSTNMFSHVFAIWGSQALSWKIYCGLTLSSNVFACISRMPPNSYGNMHKHEYVWCFQGRGHQGKYIWVLSYRIKGL